MYCNELAHWSVRQKLNHVSLHVAQLSYIYIRAVSHEQMRNQQIERTISRVLAALVALGGRGAKV